MSDSFKTIAAVFPFIGVQKMTHKIFDRQIHRDEFKLRLLLTDTCNQNCGFCLNDFQEKPKGNPKFLDTGLALVAIATYAISLTVESPRQVYFSGGEPTLHRDAALLIQTACELGCRVTVNTNGSFPNSMIPILSDVDCLHIGVYGVSPFLRDRLVNFGATLQCVYSKRFPYIDREFIKYYANAEIPIKIFGDLREDQTEYRKFAEEIVKEFPKADLSFRFTGVQENRGIGCNNCDRYCVTLKGAWVFPDGGVSHCPQKCKGEVYYPGPHGWSWKEALSNIEKLHRTS